MWASSTFEREFGEARTARMIDLFVTETLGLKKVA
jgi:hypothetical protein